MEQWRLPVQGFSLSTVLSSREYDDSAARAEFMKAEAIVLRGLNKATGEDLRRFEVVKVEIVENPRLKRRFKYTFSRVFSCPGSSILTLGH